MIIHTYLYSTYLLTKVHLPILYDNCDCTYFLKLYFATLKAAAANCHNKDVAKSLKYVHLY